MEALIDEFDAPPQPAAVDPNPRRPWDDWVEAGTPADPPDFIGHPRIWNGERARVLVHGLGDKAEARGNVLLRYPYQDAYVPAPNKTRIQTITGWVEICSVLRRWKPDEDPSSSEEENDVHDDDVQSSRAQNEEVVFEMTPEFVAVKVHLFDLTQREGRRLTLNTMREIMALQLIEDSDAQHVIGVRDCIFDENARTINVVMRHCRGGDFIDIIERSVKHAGRGLPEVHCRFWMYQVVCGLRELSSLGICHRDLSPENIMMDANNSLVIDLGLCLRVPYVEEIQNGYHTVEEILANRQDRRNWNRLLCTPQRPCGKLSYVSPEIYQSRDPFDGSAADVWSAGTVLFCMLTGTGSYNRPFDLKFQWMTQRLEELFRTWGIAVSPECLNLLRGMLTVSPRERLTLDEVINHEWFQMPNAVAGDG